MAHAEALIRKVRAGLVVVIVGLLPVTAFVLAVAAASFTLWQNAHLAVLWDLGYLLDSSWRMALGEHPYRDFPFAHAPLTFLLQAGIIRCFGRAAWHHAAYAAFVNAVSVLLTWRILRHIVRAEGLALLLTAPLLFLGVYSVYPHPIYDGDAVLAVLFALWCMVRLNEETRPAWAVLTGFAAVLPLFFKQNIGLFFLAGMVVAFVAVEGVATVRGRGSRNRRLVVAAGVLALASAAALIQALAGIGNYVHWTFAFAAQRRLPGLAAVLGVYHQSSLLWSVPVTLLGVVLVRLEQRAARIAGAALVLTPFVWVLVQLCRSEDVGDRADAVLALWPHVLVLATLFALAQLRRVPTMSTLVPCIVLLTVHGTFLSQQLWGSTYALWPLLMVLIGSMVAVVRAQEWVLVGGVAVTLLVAGADYAIHHDRLGYMQLEGAERAAMTPSLAGMQTPGAWLPEFDELVAWCGANVPARDSVVIVPGEAPFFYATGRRPAFPVLLLDPATNPYSPVDFAAEVERRQIQWLIVPKELQLVEPPEANYQEYVDALTAESSLAVELRNYRVYRRR